MYSHLFFHAEDDDDSFVVAKKLSSCRKPRNILFTFKACPATVRKTKFTVKYIICMRDVFPSSTQVEKRGLQSTTRNCIFLSNQSGHSKGIREGSKMQYLC